jgi:hypothetical protein
LTISTQRRHPSVSSRAPSAGSLRRVRHHRAARCIGRRVDSVRQCRRPARRAQAAAGQIDRSRQCRRGMPDGPLERFRLHAPEFCFNLLKGRSETLGETK